MRKNVVFAQIEQRASDCACANTLCAPIAIPFTRAVAPHTYTTSASSAAGKATTLSTPTLIALVSDLRPFLLNVLVYKRVIHSHYVYIHVGFHQQPLFVKVASNSTCVGLVRDPQPLLLDGLDSHTQQQQQQQQPQEQGSSPSLATRRWVPPNSREQSHSHQTIFRRIRGCGYIHTHICTCICFSLLFPIVYSIS